MEALLEMTEQSRASITVHCRQNLVLHLQSTPLLAWTCKQNCTMTLPGHYNLAIKFCSTWVVLNHELFRYVTVKRAVRLIYLWTRVFIHIEYITYNWYKYNKPFLNIASVCVNLFRRHPKFSSVTLRCLSRVANIDPATLWFGCIFCIVNKNVLTCSTMVF